ncbi:VOC family protein [Nocardioides plantarum]|uniref:VOC family protein n=1 Tax=Nocardioides plantarum TaxID=29299 RepID=A0ABV5KDF2_9ACTN|nr:VOC family protein [Nocardioides plantarum]
MVPITMTFDCADARAQAAFWAVALGYEEAPPPTGWDTWESWLRDHEVPEDEWDDGASIRDPDGVGPSIGFLRVPEPKTAKNRLHLDLQVAGGRHVAQAEREGAIRAKVEQLLPLGATVLHEAFGPRGLDHVVLADPEGNELCVV